MRTSPENAQRNIFSYHPFLWLENFKKFWLMEEFSHLSYFYVIHNHLLILASENTALY